MQEMIDNWNSVATFFTVWGAAGIVVAIVTLAVTSRRKGRAQAEEDEILMLEAMLRHPSGKDYPDAP